MVRSAILVLAAAQPKGYDPEDTRCKNPLFLTHWYDRDDPRSIGPMPQVQTTLHLCPAYNEHFSCCTDHFETQILKYFIFWRQIFQSKLSRLEHHRKAIRDIAKSDLYKASSAIKQEQHTFALNSFDKVMDQRVHEDCLTAMLTYAAGILCFSCKEDWKDYLYLPDAESSDVLHVGIKNSVCVELWERCRDWGSYLHTMRQAVLDSELARHASSAMEDMHMFRDQQVLCDWMHEKIALHPFPQPSEEDREAAPMAQVIDKTIHNNLSPQQQQEIDESQRRLLSDATESPTRRTADFGAQYPSKELDLMLDGKKSGLEIPWLDPKQFSAYAGLVGVWLVAAAHF
jgi:hypothetical protein